MAGINFLGIKSGSSQSKAHRYLATKRQNAQVSYCKKAKHIDILLQKSKTHRYLAAKKQGTQVSYCEFARKFKALKSLELPQRFALSNPLCVFCVDTSLRSYGKEFVILSVAKNPKNLRYTLILWILRYAQYDRDFVMLSE